MLNTREAVQAYIKTAEPEKPLPDVRGFGIYRLSLKRPLIILP